MLRDAAGSEHLAIANSDGSCKVLPLPFQLVHHHDCSIIYNPLVSDMIVLYLLLKP